MVSAFAASAPGATSQRNRAIFHTAADASAREGFERFGSAELGATFFRALDDGRSQRVLAAAFERCCEPQETIRVKAIGRLDRNQLRLALSERARLVHDQRVHLAHQLDGLGILEQHAQGRALPGRHHDGHRRGQSQCARAGNDQHCHCVNNGMRQARVRSPHGPDCKCQRSNADDDGHEVSRHHIGEFLDRRAAALRLADHSNDLRQQSF